MSDEDEAYRRKLDAQTLRWRLVIGVGSWGLAIAMLGFVGLVLGDASFVHVEGRGRLVAYATPMILTLFAAGWVLLRVGEIELATGKLVRSAPVPWPRIGALVLVALVIAAALIAWPLGVYTSIRAASSSCGALVPLEALRRAASAPLSYATVTFEDEGCDVGIAAPGHGALPVLLRERPAPDDHEWRSLLSRFHPDTRESLYLEGTDASVLLVNDDTFVIAIRRRTTASFVQLRRDTFDRDDALAIAGALGGGGR